jgi:hypothetical protein
MSQHPHLTEDERQMLADDTLSAERREHAAEHLRACAACADDVARLAAVAERLRGAPPAAPAADDLWPSIRKRIDDAKVVAIDPIDPPPASRFTWRHRLGVAIVAAGVVLTVLVLRPSHSVPVEEVPRSSDTASLRMVADSVRSYEEEARVLLNRLEIQRAMLRPDAVAAIDADLRAIDEAIEELKRAIAEDPNNPALRRLLATSFRQKIELLKRAGNAS